MNLYVRLASMPLRIKLVIGLMVGALATIALPILAMALYSQNGTPAVHTMVESMTQDRLDTLNQVINTASEITARLTNDPEYIGYYTALVTNNTDADSRHAAETAFQLALNDQLTFREIRFVGLNGVALASVPPVDNQDDTKSGYYNALK